MKIGPFDAEWDRVVATTEAKGDLTPPPLEPPGRTGAGVAEWGRMAPVEAVLRAYNQLEHEVRRVVEEKVGSERVAKGGATEVARQARELGLIDDRTVEAIEGITVLRNLAAHGREEVSVEKALDYLALTDATMYAIRSRSARSARGVPVAERGADA